MTLSRRAALVIAVTLACIGLVLWADSAATPMQQNALGLFGVGILAWQLWLADKDDRAIVLCCVVVSTAAELFCTQVWGLYHYRFGNLPLYVPPGHGLLCLASLTVARLPVMARLRTVVLWATTAVAMAWSIGGLLLPAQPDIEGALFLVGFFPLLWLTNRGIEHSTTFALASVVELVGTQFQTWEWARIVPWSGLPAVNPPSGAAGGYCSFTFWALGLWWAWRAVGAARSRALPAVRATEPS